LHLLPVKDIADAQLLAARECGADMAFLEAIESEEQIKAAVKALAPMPVSPNPAPANV
jgi:2-methylisocitrate lyase-like PEP mutase family enzyme